MFLELILLAKKDEILAEFIVFPEVFPWHFYLMPGHSLVELTEHDDSAADIILHSVYRTRHICFAAFLVHNVYR